MGDEKNESRAKKSTAFEKSVYAAEKESEEEAFQMVRDFRSLKKKVLAQLDKEDIPTQKKDAEEMVQELLKQLGHLENQLMANEIQLQESIDEAISDFEAKIGDMVKVMADKGREFFTRLEELEKGFFTGVMEGAMSEMEAFSQNQLENPAYSDNDQNKARFLANREEMTQACTNFNESHMSLIQNKDDQMQNSMNQWLSSFFKRHRERQYHRNRQRIMDTKKVIDECKAEIHSAIEVGDEYEDHDNGGGDMYGR